MPNKYTFNKSEIDALDFLPENKNKKEVSKDRDSDFGIRQISDKNAGKNQNLKKILQKKHKWEDKKNLLINRQVLTTF